MKYWTDSEGWDFRLDTFEEYNVDMGTFGLFLIGASVVDTAGDLVEVQARADAADLTRAATAVRNGITHAVQLKYTSVYGRQRSEQIASLTAQS